jgi:hypothetical protein
VTVWTFLTALVASFTALWIAYKVYPWQKKLDRELQIEAEKRKIVAQLVSAMEEFTIKVNSSNAVGLKTVPYFTKEIAAIEAAIGVVRVYDLGNLPQAADEYKKSVKEWRLKILNAKRKRPVDFKRGSKRPDGYVAAMSKANDQFEKVKCSRTKFFKSATSVFGVKDESLALELASTEEAE